MDYLRIPASLSTLRTLKTPPLGPSLDLQLSHLALSLARNSSRREPHLSSTLSRLHLKFTLLPSKSLEEFSLRLDFGKQHNLRARQSLFERQGTTLLANSFQGKATYRNLLLIHLTLCGKSWSLTPSSVHALTRLTCFLLEQGRKRSFRRFAFGALAVLRLSSFTECDGPFIERGYRSDDSGRRIDSSHRSFQLYASVLFFFSCFVELLSLWN